jgi:hypothetical protein
MYCGICGQEWAVRIANTVQGGAIELCKSHWEYMQEAERQALAALLEGGK